MFVSRKRRSFDLGRPTRLDPERDVSVEDGRTICQRKTILRGHRKEDPPAPPLDLLQRSDSVVSTSSLRSGLSEDSAYVTGPSAVNTSDDSDNERCSGDSTGSDSPNLPISGGDRSHAVAANWSLASKRQRQLKRFGFSDTRTVSKVCDSDSDDEAEDQNDDVIDSDDDVGRRNGFYLPDAASPSSSGQPVSKSGRFRKPKVSGFKRAIEQIDELMKDFRLTDETYGDIIKLLEQEMTRGLQKKTHHSSTVRMYPTYVRAIPDGTETGRFIALDLGGTNFRVLLVDLRGEEEAVTCSKLFLIPMRIMLGTGTMLFDHIARCIAEFMEAEGLQGYRYPLGFTFSFPCYQEGLASARLVRWTKGFKCTGVQGRDVVQLLQEAIERRGDIEVDCLAIINDPVGALMAAAHSDKNCHVGLILGTGTNCCFMEQLDNVELWDHDRDDPKQVVVNTEWGAFGDNGVLEFIRNSFDKELDKDSLNPGHQLFEKMISGMYMGEIVRLVLCELTERNLIFSGEGSEELFTPKRFFTKYISEIESDKPDGNFPNTKLVLQELDTPHFTLDDCRLVQHVCWQVSQRAAFLAGTAVATVIRRLQRPDVTVGVDGSLYRFHPHFKDLMDKKIRQLVDPEQKFRLVLSHDGSGKGAALVAAVAQRTKAQQAPPLLQHADPQGDGGADLPPQDTRPMALSTQRSMSSSDVGDSGLPESLPDSVTNCDASRSSSASSYAMETEIAS